MDVFSHEVELSHSHQVFEYSLLSHVYLLMRDVHYNNKSGQTYKCGETKVCTGDKEI